MYMYAGQSWERNIIKYPISDVHNIIQSMYFTRMYHNAVFRKQIFYVDRLIRSVKYQ